MTQEQLNQIFEDICLHGRHVEGWSCEDLGAGHLLKDVKRNDIWQRATSDAPWISMK